MMERINVLSGNMLSQFQSFLKLTYNLTSASAEVQL